MPSQIESETAAITLRNGSKIIPRAAQRADREIIQKFRNDCGWDEDKVDDWFDMTENGERLQYLFADEENNTWAMIALDLEDKHYHDTSVASIATKTGCVASLFIAESKRNQGAARPLIQYLEVQAKRHGVEWITCNTMPVNAASLRLFGSLGYKEYKREPRYEHPSFEGKAMAVFSHKKLE
ncbi:unnamed protein product [Umbelopsis vinacea]